MMAKHKRWLALGIASAIFIVSLWSARRLRLEEDLAALLPASDPVVRDYQFLSKRLGMLNALYFDIGAESKLPANREYVTAVAERLCRGLADSGLFAQVQYRMSAEGWPDLLENLGDRRSCLLGERDLSALAASLTPEGVDERLGAAWRSLIEPSGSFARGNVRKDPLALDKMLFVRLEAMGRDYAGTQIVDGAVWSGDTRHTLLVALPISAATDTRRAENTIRAVDEACASAVRCAPAGAVRIAYTGAHRAALDNAKTIKKDISRIVTATTIAIAICALLFFRSRLAILHIFLPALFGTALAGGIIAIFNPGVSAIATGCGGVLIGMAVDYGIQVLYRIENARDPLLTPQACARSMALAMAMAAGTTIAALLCLLFSAIPGQHQLGIFASIGIFASAVFSLTVLPWLLPASAGHARRPSRLADSYGRLLAWQSRHKKAIAFVLIAIVAAAAWGTSRVAFEGDVSNLEYLSPATRADQELIRAVWGKSSATLVAVGGATREQALQANDRLCELLDAMKEDGSVTGFSSISTFLPSTAMQRRNWERWRAFWSTQRRASLQSRLSAAMAHWKFAPGACDPFLESLDSPFDPVLPSHFQRTAIETLLRNQLIDLGGETLVLSTFTPAGNADLERLVSRIRVAFPDSHILSARRMVQHLTGIVHHELRTLVLAAFAAVLLCVFLLFWRIELVVTAFIPIGLSLLLTFGALGLLGIRINMFNAMFVLFLFGAGIDYGGYMLAAELGEFRGGMRYQDSSFGAVILCFLTTLCGFAPLIFAKHPALFSIGVAGTVTMASSLAAGVLLVPPITRLLLRPDATGRLPSARSLVRSILVGSYLGSAGVLYVCVARYWARLRWRQPESRAAFARRYLHAMAIGLRQCYPSLSSDHLYIGVDGMPSARPAVIVSNHLSSSDIICILTLPVELVMVVKRWVWQAPLIGPMIRDAGYILTRGDGVETLVAEAAEHLRRGVSIVVFAEGTRSLDGRLGRFHKGAFELAIRAGADLAPILLTNTQACLAPRSIWLGAYRMIIRALPRITPANADYGQGAKALACRVRRELSLYQEADWRTAQAGESFWRNLRSLYNFRGAGVEASISIRLRMDPVCRHIDEAVPISGTIIDIGCGQGLICNILARKSLRRQVIGIDGDAARTAIARATAALNMAVETADIITWDLPLADCVLLLDVLHRWSMQDQARIVEKLAACLRPGGTLIFRGGTAAQTRAGSSLLEQYGFRACSPPDGWARRRRMPILFSKAGN